MDRRNLTYPRYFWLASAVGCGVYLWLELWLYPSALMGVACVAYTLSTVSVARRINAYFQRVAP